MLSGEKRGEWRTGIDQNVDLFAGHIGGRHFAATTCNSLSEHHTRNQAVKQANKHNVGPGEKAEPARGGGGGRRRAGRMVSCWDAKIGGREFS